MSKIIAGRMIVGDDELHFRDDDAQKKLEDLIVQEKGNSKTAVMSQAAATEEFDKLSEDIDELSDVVVFDWTTRKNTSQTGWVHGFYISGETTPSVDTSRNFIRTEMFIPVAEYDKLKVTPPKGYAVEVVAIKDDKTFEWIGNANINTNPENVNVEVELDLIGVISVGVSVGRFEGDGNVYASDSSFCSQVVMTLTRFYNDEKGEQAYNELFSEQYNWDRLAHDDAPTGWVKGYFSPTNNSVAESDNFITTTNAITLNDAKCIMVAPPKGYAVEINALKSDGTYDTFGNANNSKSPQYTDVPLSVNMRQYKSIRVSIGHLDGDAASFIKDKAFIYDIVMRVTYNNAIESGAPKTYFKEEIGTTVISVRELLTEPCLVFPLITDIHYKSVTAAPQIFDTSIINMQNVVKQIACDFVLDLGDNIGGYTDKTESRKRVDHMMNQFRTLRLPLISAIGNHDTNYYHNSDDMFSLSEMFGLYISSTKDVVYNHAMSGTDYYKDFDNLNIRLVVLNGSYGDRYKYSTETVNWFINTALDTDKMVILAVHFSIINTQNYNHTGDKTNGAMMAAAITDFINNGGTLIQLCGHSHIDYAYTSPWLTVYSSAAMFENVDLTTSGYTKLQGYTGNLVAPKQEVGTVTEDCWSVVVVRPQARKINFVRFGAGEDREFSF